MRKTTLVLIATAALAVGIAGYAFIRVEPRSTVNDLLSAKAQAPSPRPVARWQSECGVFVADMNRIARSATMSDIGSIPEPARSRVIGKDVTWTLPFGEMEGTKPAFDLTSCGILQEFFSGHHVLVSFEAAPNAVAQWGTISAGQAVRVDATVREAGIVFLGELPVVFVTLENARVTSP